MIHRSTFSTYFLLSLAAIALAMPCLARGLTPSMIRRNGLTDEQIDAVFAANSNAQLRLTAQHWRNLTYRLNRFDNMRGWLNEQIEGRLGDRILAVTDTNAVLVASNGVLRVRCVRLAEDAAYYFSSWTNQLAETAALSNLYVIVSAQATAAQAKIEGEIADLRAKIATYESYKTKYPILKSIWTALINDAQNRIRILEALTANQP